MLGSKVYLVLYMVAMLTIGARSFFVPSHSGALQQRSEKLTLQRSTARRSRTMTMKVELKNMSELDRMKGLEKDSKRWFEVQEERERNGELLLLENPAFYVVLFFLAPTLIIVWAVATDVIPILPALRG